MPRVLAGNDHLRNLFAAVTEQTFQVQFGLADPPLIDYLADMLVRFIRVDAIFKVRNIIGHRLEEVAEMMMEAEKCTSKPKGEIHRHIGDFTLFWTGVYPEGLKQLKHWDRQDAVLDYQTQGKRSYYIASQLIEKADETESRSSVLRRLSDEFEICSEGLRRVRQEWEQLPGYSCN